MYGIAEILGGTFFLVLFFGDKEKEHITPFMETSTTGGASPSPTREYAVRSTFAVKEKNKHIK